jgi:hypothetical protein
LQYTFNVADDLVQHVRDIFNGAESDQQRQLYIKLFHLIVKACVTQTRRDAVEWRLRDLLDVIINKQVPYLLYMHTQRANPKRWQELRYRLNSPWTRVHSMMCAALKRVHKLHTGNNQLQKITPYFQVPWWLLDVLKDTWNSTMFDSILVASQLPLPVHLTERILAMTLNSELALDNSDVVFHASVCKEHLLYVQSSG